MPDNKQTLPQEISWKTHSRNRPQRSPGWYVIFAILTLAAIAFGVFYSRSVITTLTFVLIALVVLALSRHDGNETTYRLSETGISTGRIQYPYQAITQFWIDYRPPEVKTLNFQTTAYVNNKITIQLGHQDPVAVKLFLSQYLPEDLGREESTAEVLARKLKI